MRLLITAASMLLLFSSCQKDLVLKEDAVNAETVSNDATGSSEFSGCKLRRVRLKHPEINQYINGLFTYNSAGNPISLVFKDATDDEEPFVYPGYYFTYNKQGRLTGLHHKIISGDDEWHTYAYDANNRIIADTAQYGWSFKRPGEDITRKIQQIFISTFTYDAQGRTVKETIKNTYNRDSEGQIQPLLPTRNPTFTYDARGNLGVTGWKSPSYDNKVSIFRSHPLLQFIARNYSKNNSSVQSKYNSKGLPLQVTPGNDNFFDYYKAVDRAIYDCQ